jgi:hypothetical protein
VGNAVREPARPVLPPANSRSAKSCRNQPRKRPLSSERKFQAVADDPEFHRIMKDIGQPVMHMPAAEYKVWFKQEYDRYGELIKKLGVETK